MAFGKTQYLRCRHNIALLPSESSVMVAMSDSQNVTFA